MDISRIDSYRPKIYDWRNMTAREIVRHDDDGDKVPAMYLRWARELNSIESDDVTTYEIAVSGKNKTENTQPENKIEENSEDTEQPQLSKAEQKRKEMADNGIDLIGQAVYFENQSSNLTSESFPTTHFILPALQNASQSELTKLAFTMIALDERMENVLSNLKNIAALSKVSNSPENNDSIVQRVYKEGKELDKIALKGHSSVSKTEADIDSIGASMGSYVPTFDDTIDYGGQTVDIGNQLSDTFPIFYLKAAVIDAGNQAINIGNKGLKTEAESQDINNTNLDKADDFHNFIETKSSIQSPEPQKNYKRDKRGVSEAEEKKEEAQKQGQSEVEKTATNIDPKQKEDIKKEDKDLPRDREELRKLQDEDKNTKVDLVKNASKQTTVQDAPSKKEFADDNQQTEAKNEFEKAKENDGADERTTVMAIREESKGADNEAVTNMGVAKLLAQMSQTSYNELDENIQELMNEINNTQEEIKNEIRAVNSGLSGDISRINQLNEELRSYGVNAQSITGSYEGIINGYASELENIGDSFSGAISKGHEASNAGAELISNSEDRWLAYKLVNGIIGQNTINVGERTANDGVRGLAGKSQASSSINSNLLSIASLKSEIQAKTGVEGSSGKSKENHNDTDNTNNNEIIMTPEEKVNDITKPNLEKPKEKVKDSDKAVKIAQNDGTDTTDKQNTDINAIIARKIGHGEVNMG